MPKLMAHFLIANGPDLSAADCVKITTINICAQWARSYPHSE